MNFSHISEDCEDREITPEEWREYQAAVDKLLESGPPITQPIWSEIEACIQLSRLERKKDAILLKALLSVPFKP